MKKLFLLGAMVCAGQMYGMEPIEPKNPRPELGAFGYLPEDVHRVIIQRAIESSDTLEKAIQAINAASALRGVKYDNLQDFTKLVHLLADKFNMTTAQVAKQFTTPVAKKYLNLGQLLLDFSGDATKQVEEIKLINQGADVNFSEIRLSGIGVYIVSTPLSQALESAGKGDYGIEWIKTLLKLGAKITDRVLYLISFDEMRPKLRENFIMRKQLIKEAMQKQQQ